MAQDLLVKLWSLPDKMPVLQALQARGVSIKRVIAPDRGRVLAFVREHFGEGWMHECEAALSTVPSTCYIAVREREILGFSCFEATGKDYFGPIGVKKEARVSGVGTGLLLCSLHSMWAPPPAHATTGRADEPSGSFETTAAAVPIEGGHPAIYQNLIRK